MSPRLVFGQDVWVARWVATQLGFDMDDFEALAALGVVLGDRILAGVVFHGYVPEKHGAIMQVSIASVSPRWCNRRILGQLFSYPFKQAGVTRLWTQATETNSRAIRFNERLGFTREGIARAGWDGKHDAVVFSMLPHECKWIDHGQETTQTAAAA